MIKLMTLAYLLLITGCLERQELGVSSFGANKQAQAGAASVISMGRDDDDGKALKWHIGGKD